MVQDPVCLMNVEESEAAATNTYKGKTYYFWQSAARRGLRKSLKSMLMKQGDMSKGNTVIKGDSNKKRRKEIKAMKQVLVITILTLGLMVTFSFAHMQEGMMGSDMMGSQSQKRTGWTPYYYGYCPHMMGANMMGYGMMGPGMMGHGMPGMGMMGPGMMGMMHGGGMGYGMGTGMMGYGNVEAYQKFLNETVDLRKELHNKRFEYFEALRNPKTKPETITKLEKEIQELQNKIYEKTPR